MEKRKIIIVMRLRKFTAWGNSVVWLIQTGGAEQGAPAGNLITPPPPCSLNPPLGEVVCRDYGRYSRQPVFTAFFSLCNWSTWCCLLLWSDWKIHICLSLTGEHLLVHLRRMSLLSGEELNLWVLKIISGQTSPISPLVICFLSDIGTWFVVQGLVYSLCSPRKCQMSERCCCWLLCLLI